MEAGLYLQQLLSINQMSVLLRPDASFFILMCILVSKASQDLCDLLSSELNASSNLFVFVAGSLQDQSAFPCPVNLNSV